MSLRKLTINDEVWQWQVGKKFVEIRPPEGKKTCPLKQELFLETCTKEQASLFYEHWYAYDNDYREDPPSTPITPSMVQTYILKNLV